MQIVVAPNDREFFYCITTRNADFGKKKMEMSCCYSRLFNLMYNIIFESVTI